MHAPRVAPGARTLPHRHPDGQRNRDSHRQPGGGRRHPAARSRCGRAGGGAGDVDGSGVPDPGGAGDDVQLRTGWPHFPACSRQDRAGPATRRRGAGGDDVQLRARWPHFPACSRQDRAGPATRPGHFAPMTLWARVVEANRPGPPEHSIRFRLASALVMVIAIGACWSQGELGAPLALFTIAATIIGNTLSYRRREQPWSIVKPILAACVVGGFVWFIITVTHGATPGDISTVEKPLAVLFAWVLSTHAFDVPARRDVAYSLAGSATLMAVAAAQSVDLSLGIYVVAWVVCGLWGLVSMWQSMSGVHGVPWITLGGAGLPPRLLALM